MMAGLVLSVGFLHFAASIDEEERLPLRRAEAIVALTGGPDRIPDAVSLLANGYAKRLLISGVNQTISRAEIAQLAPRFRALVECCVELGYEARNTVGNAEEARRWFTQNGLRGPLMVVTSNYHMPRALVELASVLPGVDLVPVPVITEKLRRVTWWKDPQVARLWAFEYVKYVASLARITVRGLSGERPTRVAASN
jgi:uncharacterized SAM-binding protein YcdF (DUF218 family)